MIPGCFPLLPLSGEPGTYSLNPAAFQSALFPSVGGTHQTMPSGQLLQYALIQESLRHMNANLLSPFVYSPNSAFLSTVGNIGILAGPVHQAQLNAATGVAPLLLCPTISTSAVANNPGEDLSKSMDSHTIIRAPVIYKTSTSSGDAPQTKSDGLKDSEQSPPDRIVASYAAAAHAAALVNHQPVSKAAENFLSVTTAVRSRHSKRSRTQPSSLPNRLGVFDPVISSSTITVTTNTIATKEDRSTVLSIGTESADGERRAGWSRILDRTAGTVEYISPEGTRLRNRTEVATYLRTQYPGSEVGSRYDEWTACFVFEPIPDSPTLMDRLNTLPQLMSSPLSSINPTQPTETVTSSSSASDPCLQDPSEVVKPAGSVCRISFNPNRSIDEDFCLTKRRRKSSSVSEVVSGGATDESNSDAALVDNSEQPPQLSPNSLFQSDVPNSDTAGPLSCAMEPNPEGSSLCEEIPVLSNTTTVAVTDPESIVLPTVMAPTVHDTTVIVEDNQAQTNVSFSAEQTSFTGTSSWSDTTTCILSSMPESQNIDTIARVNSETFTTGLLHSSVSSGNFTVSPSVVPHSEQYSTGNNDVGQLTFSSAQQGSSSGQPSSSLAGNTNQLLAFNQLVATARLAQAQQQQQQQQQQLFAAMASLSADAMNNQSVSAAHLVNHPSQLYPLLLSNTSQYNTGWNAGSWMDMASSGTANPSLALQQQLLTAVAIQQQQQQQQQQVALSLLLQKQQQGLATTQPQLLNPASQVQAYLAAVQRQFFPTT